MNDAKSLNKTTPVFTNTDCSIFAKYDRSISWNEVPDVDKELINGLRARLKDLAKQAEEAYTGTAAVKAFVSHPAPNGRTPKELWCCIYPVLAANKSYGLQIALIVMSSGIEICFCLGAGTGQIANQDKLRAAQDSFSTLQARLANLPTRVDGSNADTLLDSGWSFREKWKLAPGAGEFDTLKKWLAFASSARGGGASISKYYSVDEINSGQPIAQDYLAACELFRPVMDMAYSQAPLPDNENSIETAGKKRNRTFPTFLETMQRYHDERVVFLSPTKNQRYVVTGVDELGCQVNRLDGNEPIGVTEATYLNKLVKADSQGGSIDRFGLDSTVAKHMTLLQGAELGLSADCSQAVRFKNLDDAAKNLSLLIQGISSPQLYKPAILKLVIQGVRDGELNNNRIEFDWLLPRFVEEFNRRGKEVAEQQLAEGFGRLTGDLFWLLAHKDPNETLSADKPTANQIRNRITHALFKDPYWQVICDPNYQEQLLKTIDKHWPNLTQGTIDPEEKSMIETKLSLNDATKKLVADIDAFGFVFQPWQIATYVTALRTKPFVILAGVSGTGKSKLPMLVARFSGAAEPRRIAVRPDWTDSAEVIGFVNLQDQFQPGVVLQEMRAASKDSSRHHVCLIDEMNIARVEHYFAEILSAIEDRKSAVDGGYESSRIITQDLSTDLDAWSSQVIPANLGIVGTVNMDESTHGFSRKVLDRAFTIELSEIELDSDLAANENSAERNEAIAAWPRSYWDCKATRLAEIETGDHGDEIRDVIDLLKLVNKSLQLSQLQVGYRTRDEIILFILNAKDVEGSFHTKSGEAVDPLDLALMMKVLPRIVGGSNSIRRTLLGLLGIATTGSPPSFDDEPTELIDNWEREGRTAALSNAKFPRTASRLCLMWERLEIEGYTSFWL